jgi:hypothetical protein
MDIGSVIAASKAKQRGINAEKITKAVLEELCSGHRIEKFDRHNFDGVDYDIFLLSGKKVPIQVKNSSGYAVWHILEHPDIPVIVVHCTTGMRLREKRKRFLGARNWILQIIKNAEDEERHALAA